jgi:16S rRNA (cytosine1402-N4)-methyltransferase
MAYQHRPVLLKEVLEGLHIKSGGIYCDLTFGRGGHSAEILKKIGSDGRLLAMDRDPIAVMSAKDKLDFQDPRFSIVHGEFSNLEQEIKARGFLGLVDGILLDVGVSSPQLDDADRGFSFMRDGPLDMRMNPSAGISACEWLSKAKLEEISLVIRDFGEEKFHHRIAQAIVDKRGTEPLSTTLQLADLIEATVPVKEKNKHPATRTFQAIRIFINGELDELTQLLGQVLNVLKVGGRLCVISFHSLEDRIVKRFIQKQVKTDEHPSYIPLRACDVKAARMKKIGSLVRPQQEELNHNVRSRSARLRIAERLS